MCVFHADRERHRQLNSGFNTLKLININRYLKNENYLTGVVVLVAILQASWLIHLSGGVINLDGILYVEVARLFALNAWDQGVAQYDWPLYPWLIAGVHELSGFSLQSSAHLLTICFFALTAAGVIALVREAGGDRRVQLASAMLLFGSIYIVDAVLPMIVRDHGFWAAHLWSLVYFIRFYRDHTWPDAFKWGVAAGLAMLFRIEGVTYLVMLPFVLLMQRHFGWRHRLAVFAKANVVTLLTMAVLIAVVSFNGAIVWEDMGRLVDPYLVLKQVYAQLMQGLHAKADIIAREVLGEFLDEYALTGLLLTLTTALVTKGLSSAGWAQLISAAYGLMNNRQSLLPKYPGVFAWLVMLGLGNAVLIIMSIFVLSKRYVLPMAFIILVYAAFGLVAMYEAWKSKRLNPEKPNWIFPGVVIALLLQFLIAVWPPNPGKMYELEAARWLQNNVSPESSIYFDERRSRYYYNQDSSDRNQDQWEIVQQELSAENIRKYDYALVHLSRKFPERMSVLTDLAAGEPVAEFDNGRGDKVLIFKIPD